MTVAAANAVASHEEESLEHVSHLAHTTADTAAELTGCFLSQVPETQFRLTCLRAAAQGRPSMSPSFATPALQLLGLLHLQHGLAGRSQKSRHAAQIETLLSTGPLPQYAPN